MNLDAYFTVTINDPGATLTNSFWTLDAQGKAQASFSLPSGLSPNLVGFFLYHAALVVRASPSYSQLVHVTNPVAAELVP